MSSWSSNRKFIYATIVIIVVVIVVGVPTFLYFYKAPSCFDGIKNGSEQGIDCGGACQKLCQSAFLSPQVSWTRFEEIAPQVYNIATYIINPNLQGEATNVPYHIIIYDNQGLPIKTVTGTVTLPPHRNTLAFNSSINLGKSKPVKALFEFTGNMNWYVRTDPLVSLVIGNKNYYEDENGSSLSVTLSDPTPTPLERMSVYAVLYDKDSNSIGFSKTVIDGIYGNSSVTAPFTWPIYRQGKVISIEVLPVAE